MRLLRNRRGKSAKNRERGKKREKWWAFLQWKKLNSEGRNQNGYYTQWKKESSWVSYYLGIEEGNPFIWVHCLWGVFLFLNILVLLRIGDGVVVSVSVPYSLSFVCNCASLLFNFVVSVHVWNSGVDKFKCYCLTRNISTVWFNSLWIFQRGGHNSQVAADWLASRMLHNFIINGFTLFVFSGY